MPWYAVAAVDDAIDATRGFLFPFSLGRWAKLAVVVLFMGGGFSAGGLPDLSADGRSLPSEPGAPLPGDVPVSRDVLIAVAVGAVAVVLLFSLVSLAVRFVFYDALRTNDVVLWGPFRRRFGQALRLFGFQILLALPIVGPVALLAFGASRAGVDPTALGPAIWVVAGLAFAVLALALALVSRFTQEFVLPVMTLFDEGPVDAWRRFWPTLREEWVQYLAYVVIHAFVSLALSIAQGLVALLLGGIVLALGGLAGLVVVGALGGFQAVLASTAGLAALAVLALAVVVTLFVVLVPIQILATTYLTTYELCVLGGTNRAFMLLPEAVVDDPDVLEDEGGDAAGVP